MDCMTGTTIIYRNLDTASGRPTEQRIYKVRDLIDFRRVLDLAKDGKVEILVIDGDTADYLHIKDKLSRQRG